MAVATAVTLKSDLNSAIAELQEQLLPGNYCLIYYVTSRPDLEQVAAKMDEAFAAHGTLFGCSSFDGEFCMGQLYEGSISVMAIGHDVVSDCWVELLPMDDTLAVQPAVERIKAHFGTDAMLQDFDQYAGFLLIATSHGEQEALLYALGNSLENQVVGGTANLTPGKWVAFWDGTLHYDTAVLVMMKAKEGFAAIKTQAVTPISEQTVSVNKTGASERELVELDGRPALEVFLERLGYDSIPDNLSEILQNYYLAMRIRDDDYYTRVFEEAVGNSLFAFANIPVGSEMYIVRNNEDIIDGTAQAIAVQTKNQQPRALLFCDCAHRLMYIRGEGIVQEYCSVFSAYPHLGFSCGGEAFIGHLNNTFVGLAIL